MGQVAWLVGVLERSRWRSHGVNISALPRKEKALSPGETEKITDSDG